MRLWGLTVSAEARKMNKGATLVFIDGVLLFM